MERIIYKFAETAFEKKREEIQSNFQKISFVITSEIKLL